VGDGFIHKEYLAPAFLTFYRFSIDHLNGFTLNLNFDINRNQMIRRKIGKQLRRISIEKFSWDGISKRLLQ